MWVVGVGRWFHIFINKPFALAGLSANLKLQKKRALCHFSLLWKVHSQENEHFVGVHAAGAHSACHMCDIKANLAAFLLGKHAWANYKTALTCVWAHIRFLDWRQSIYSLTHAHKQTRTHTRETGGWLWRTTNDDDDTTILPMMDGGRTWTRKSSNDNDGEWRCILRIRDRWSEAFVRVIYGPKCMFAWLN